MIIRPLGLDYRSIIFLKITMTNLESVRKLVEDYERHYRGPDLSPLEYVEEYRFGCGMPCPELAARQGVYAIFSEENLLYIGKASSPNSAIWHRIYQHIKFDENYAYLGPSKKTWTILPTHFIGWAVPKDSFFEASALEEYLIHSLSAELPYNRIK